MTVLNLQYQSVLTSAGDTRSRNLYYHQKLVFFFSTLILLVGSFDL